VTETNNDMNATIRIIPKYYKNPSDAEVAAASAEAGDDCGWKYVAVHCPDGTGFSYINVFDENGDLVGKMF
jgi:hypothetical protein